MFSTIQQWSNNILDHYSHSPILLVAVLVLGFTAAIGSCCNLGVIGAVVSYSGTQVKEQSTKPFLKTGLSFMLGNIISLSLIGALTGFISQEIGSTVGHYWMIVAGIVAVYFGLSSLGIAPIEFNLSSKISTRVNKTRNKGLLFGLALGGFATACSACCNPIFPVIMGVSYLQGDILWSWVILLIFAIGYSIPLGAILVGLGIGFNKISNVLLKNKNLIRTISGITLILVGFALLIGWL